MSLGFNKSKNPNDIPEYKSNTTNNKQYKIIVDKFIAKNLPIKIFHLLTDFDKIINIKLTNIDINSLVILSKIDKLHLYF